MSNLTIFEQIKSLPNPDIRISFGTYYDQYSKLVITCDGKKIYNSEMHSRPYNELYKLVPIVCEKQKISIPQSGLDLIKYLNTQKKITYRSNRADTFTDDNNNKITMEGFTHVWGFVVITINDSIALVSKYSSDYHPDNSETHIQTNHLYYNTLLKYNINLSTIQKKAEDEIKKAEEDKIKKAEEKKAKKVQDDKTNQWQIQIQKKRLTIQKKAEDKIKKDKMIKKVVYSKEQNPLKKNQYDINSMHDFPLLK